MAYQARVSYTANGSTDTFSFSFSYIASSHVKAYVDGVEDTSITFPTTSSITLASTPVNGAIVLIKRVTPIDTRLVDFQDGSVLSATDLDKSADQNFFVAQETSDEAQSHLEISDATNQYDAGASGSNLRITNLAEPTASTDAATKNYIDTQTTSAATSATNSATSATASAASATASASSATAAEASNVSAAAILDTFDDDYLGAKSSDPTLDNDGNALTDGALYFNTTDNRMKVYDLGATTWNYVSPSSSDQTKINTVSDNITAVSNVSTNIDSVNSFANTYRISSTAPTSSLDVGDLYFDTTANELKVYKSSGWAAAGSTVNGTSARFNYTATAAQTTFTGADTNGETLAYDAGFADVYLNGVRLSGADITITSGTSVVLATGASAGDILDVVAYGTFNVATVAASAITSGTISEARLPASALGAVWESKSANFTAEARKNYFVDTTSGAVDVTLPSGTIGDTIRFLDVSGTFDTNDLTILNGSSKIQGSSANLDVSTERAGFALVYYNSTQGWLLEDK